MNARKELVYARIRGGGGGWGKGEGEKESEGRDIERGDGEERIG